MKENFRVRVGGAATVYLREVALFPGFLPAFGETVFADFAKSFKSGRSESTKREILREISHLQWLYSGSLLHWL